MTEEKDDLPERRKAAVAAGLEQYNHVAAERDKFELEVRELRTQIAGYKVAAEAEQSRILDLESRVKTLTLERDEAVAHRTKWEGLFVTIKATLRAFNVPNEPLIRDFGEEGERAAEHLRRQAHDQQNAAGNYIPPHLYPGGILGNSGGIKGLSDEKRSS